MVQTPIFVVCFNPMTARSLIVLSLGAALASAQNPYRNDPKAAEAGRGLFRIQCSPCHGIKAEGGRGPDLTRGEYTVGDSDEALRKVIAEGAGGTEMPAFSAQLTDDTIWRLVTYIRSTTRRDTEPVTGNASAGEKLYWNKGGCSGCHRINGRGGRMGPDLSTAGRTRSLKYLRESLADPNADLVPGYNTITVVTRDGKKISGVQRGFDNFSGQLMDARDNYYSFFKTDVKSMTREFKSLMPTYSSLSATEMNDLVAYLHSLGREARP
jgi:putative heme-binding domain-containing protein